MLFVKQIPIVYLSFQIGLYSLAKASRVLIAVGTRSKFFRSIETILKKFEAEEPI